METKINVAAILKDKPQGTKLYSLTYGDCFYQEYTGDFGIECQSQNGVQFNLDEYGRYCIEGECILFPSKEMRDWEKFAWKRGDVLVNSRGLKILFDRWANDNYTSFYAKTINLVEDGFLDTNLHTLASEKEAKSFIKCIEEKLGGKLNRETLEIEKQPEYKDGDIMVSNSGSIVLVKEIKCGERVYYHACMINGNVYIKGTEDEYYGIVSDIDRLATDTEKLQFFDALAKKGKAWDAKKKMIVDKYEFKPMDLCLMKYIGQYNNRGWELCQYAYTEHRVSSSGEQRDFYHAVGGEIYAECIPYKGNEHLLGTKKSK